MALTDSEDASIGRLSTLFHSYSASLSCFNSSCILHPAFVSRCSLLDQHLNYYGYNNLRFSGIFNDFSNLFNRLKIHLFDRISHFASLYQGVSVRPSVGTYVRLSSVFFSFMDNSWTTLRTHLLVNSWPCFTYSAKSVFVICII